MAATLNRRLSTLDAGFLYSERPDQPMHVGGLQVFELPDGAGPGMLREAFQRLLAETDVAPQFRRRAYRSARTLGQWAWTGDPDVDIAQSHYKDQKERIALVGRDPQSVKMLPMAYTVVGESRLQAEEREQVFLNDLQFFLLNGSQ